MKVNINISVSVRHIHLSKEDFEILFPNEELSVERELSQKPNFASDKKVSLKNGDRIINNVRVVGPYRNETQVELSKTDCYTLGIDAPLCTSGELEDATEIEIVNGDISIKRNCAIIQNRHIHMSYEDANKFGYTDDQIVSVRINTKKGGILNNVHIKLGEEFVTELHLDTDDGNAFLIDKETVGEIIND